MLLKEFYQVNEKITITDNTWKIRLNLNPQHPIYEGHFPQQPVLPGVGTLQIIREVASSLLSIPVQYTQISSCKFLSAIDPGKTPELELTLTLKEEGNNQWQVKADGETNGEPFIKLKATLKGRIKN
ncbi:hydroxymyristoyl-ACP dehydratase [Bacteroides sp. 519]|uniref:ApeI family dehydratase n=1 Tax=Bacteroides sp. 519 TaxID=2302937 RepID=UPI0013D510A1|nr:hydroxymyristoyl-ACP dehydratase [Bacteroides sp. 519]NDV60702.1 hydroxymyristoyl-ACP dehydratase [Bacteroides sp. 519]